MQIHFLSFSKLIHLAADTFEDNQTGESESEKQQIQETTG